MMMTKLTAMPGRQARADVTVSLSLAIVAAFFVVSGFVSYFNIKTLNRDSQQVTRTHGVILSLNEILSVMKDAETGQRGFVLTGRDSYLDPYNEALTRIEQEEISLREQTLDEPNQQARVGPLKQHIDAKLAELGETINLRRSDGFESALAIVLTDHGKRDMDAVRAIVTDMQADENKVRAQRLAEIEHAYTTAVISISLAAALGLIITVAIIAMIRRTAEARRKEEWLQAGQVGLSAVMMGEQRMDELGRNILGYLADYCHAQAGAFFVRDGGAYQRVATYGAPADSDIPSGFTPGVSLLGQVASSGNIMSLKGVSEDHLVVGAALGQWRPHHLIITPAKSEGVVDAVFELGFLHTTNDNMLELMNRVSEFVSVAVRSANYRANLQNFLEETQRQSEELQSQSEELRVNNEELEEQGRALRETHARLEQQQAELEQTNSVLEEQAATLEGQRNDLERAKSDVETKARELEQASQYKSDFLANMSHELRTPLNSSLILAKLLADNTDGNLSAEQVKFAQTIQSSGNDLLALINDILDLSKIEAGHMDIRPETVSLNRLVGDLTRTFDPVAQQKGLSFTTHIAKDLPETVETDRQRLEQILKNLLSNAFKFTEKGGVTLDLSATRDGRIAIAVTDTGVGIADEQQRAVFDAFRQADGTISRKYGGTGLGLSISRELTRLLNGTITLASTPGEGSTFTLTLPAILGNAPAAPQPAPVRKTSTKAAKPSVPAPSAPAYRIDDDRDRITEASRSILVIEDDAPFARILYDLAHDLDFLCLLSSTAEDAIIVARQYMPSAVVMDVGLPDNSGLSVLDRLKRDPRTRHIPVHVVSGNDYTHTALSLGAIGFMLKPVKREELVDAFKQLESRLTHRVRRVLIVEDDAVQRDSVARLLKSQDVETVAVGTAAECLDLLKDTTFDCMVLDLSLPDASGYSLLESLSQEDAYSFPPVIVYTGRDLSYDDEQQLRRYSKSIIIKGVKSPERLLDEVTLFLHQVVSELSPEQQTLLKKAKNRDAVLEGRRILIVEDDVRNVYAVTNILEPLGAVIQIARNGREALEALATSKATPDSAIDLVLMDVMMPEMDGLTATRELRKLPEWKKLPVIMLTAKAMRDDQERCLEAGANDYMAKPLDVEKLISLVRVWMPR